MKGLSADERRLLAMPRPYFQTEEEESVIAALLMQGRVHYLSDCWKNTDLGNMALRVCPAEELV